MQAAVTTSAAKSSGTLPAPHPMILLDHQLQPDWQVLEYQCSAPLDERRVTLQRLGRRGDPMCSVRLEQGRWFVVQPMRLGDDSCRWPVLLEGFASQSSDASTSEQLHLHDHWTLRLRERVDTWWWQAGQQGITSSNAPAALHVGDHANRSAASHFIAGKPCHVLASGGYAWTVGQALQMVSAVAHLQLELSLIQPERFAQPLITPVDLTQSMGDILQQLLEPAGLLLHRQIFREGAGVTEWRAVRSIETGRRVCVPGVSTHQPMNRLLHLKSQGQARGAQLWSAIAPGWEVESTFNLQPAWPESQEGLSAENYSKNSASFTENSLAYRMWALNEDGQIAERDDSNEPDFDLARFFGEPLQPQSRRFGACVTVDALGRRMAPIVEVSVDHGVTWSRYNGSVLIQADRAAISLDDVDLDPVYLSAALAGAARVRVTASLRSPLPVRIDRWVGNPFHGTAPARIIDSGQAFRFRRVDRASIHRELIDTGVMSSCAIDESPQMTAWLAQQISIARRGSSSDSGSATLTLSGIWPMLRPGDELRDSSASRFDAAHQSPLSRGWVECVTCTWPSAAVSNQSGQSPVTTVELCMQQGSAP